MLQPAQATAPQTGESHLDVLIVGAGISGLSAAYHLGRQCPAKTIAIFEARDSLGGTWDFYRYPGLRADSDMHTLAFSFHPWTADDTVCDGDQILTYLKDTARKFGIDQKIQYGTRILSANWSSADACWTVIAETKGPDGAPKQQEVTCNFLFMCSGYYKYDNGYLPDFPGTEDFRGQLVHPQVWPEDIDTKDKRIVVIGSGATAMSLVPELAKTAAHVTLLQRSPTYVVGAPGTNPSVVRVNRLLPDRVAFAFNRWRFILFGLFFFSMCRRRPERVKAMLRKNLEQQLGPDFEYDTHFAPRYNPWEQRLCLIRDGDLFARLRDGSASMVTDEVETFTETGLRLKSGETVEADIIVSATGFNVQLAGGLALSVDGAPVDIADTFSYKGLMFSGIPNLVNTFGYTNASWTLKAELTARYVCRLVNRMDRQGVRQCTPSVGMAAPSDGLWLDFSSSYVQRASKAMPKQGDKHPWKAYQNYLKDLAMLRFGRLEDGTLEFSNPG